MKKLFGVFLMVLIVFVGTEALAQGKSKIKISNRKVEDLVQQIKDNPNAEVLYLFRNGLDSIPEEIGLLKNLKELTVSSNNITYVPPVIGELTNLEKISLKSNKIKNIPSSFGNLKNLKDLELDNNEIVVLPETICDLENLETLSVTNNKLTHLPNHLQELPASMAELESLVELNVAGSGQMIVVPNMENCRRLEKIYIDRTIMFDGSYDPFRIPRLQVIVL